MNILFLTNHLNVGGITSYTLTLATGLKKRGHNVHVASSGGELLPSFIQQGVNFIPVPLRTKSEISPKLLISLFRLLPLIKRYDINVIHANSRTTQVLAGLISVISKVKYVSTCHGFFKVRFGRRFFPCWGKKVIAISSQVSQHLQDDFFVKESDIRIINNGINLERFKFIDASAQKEARRRFGISDNFVVGIIARLSDVKGHIYLIEAIKMVIEAVPSVKLLIVGEGKMKQKLDERINDLRIADNVVFLAHITDTREILAVMDVFVMPSLKEGLGLALMEAMASGLAVVGSNVGGIKTLIQNNSNGLLVEPGDSAGLSRAILGLLQDSSRRESLGRKAREFISQNFSQEKMILETERVYLECILR